MYLAVLARVDRREKGLWDMRDPGRVTEADEDGLLDMLDPGRADELGEGLTYALVGGRMEDALERGLSGRLGIEAERGRCIDVYGLIYGREVSCALTKRGGNANVKRTLWLEGGHRGSVGGW